MAKFSIVIGILLILLAVVAWTGVDKNFLAPMAGQAAGGVAEPAAEAGVDGATPKKSLTALIPMVAGFPLLILGTLALNPGWRKHGMHGAAGIALLGAIAGLGRGLSKVSVLTSAESYEKARPVGFSLGMGLLCLVLLVGCILSFRAARRARAAGEA